MDDSLIYFSKKLPPLGESSSQDRAQNKYVPLEKKYGSLAAYHAQKYQESIKRIINNVINEHINRKRRNRV